MKNQIDERNPGFLWVEMLVVTNKVVSSTGGTSSELQKSNNDDWYRLTVVLRRGTESLTMRDFVYGTKPCSTILEMTKEVVLLEIIIKRTRKQLKPTKQSSNTQRQKCHNDQDLASPLLCDTPEINPNGNLL
jgi:hypothetical protein